MPQLRYQALNLMQVFDVLRHASIARLAVAEDGRPYVVPVAFQLEVKDAEIILHMVSLPEGRKMNALRGNDRVCVEIDLPSCAWVDTVLVEGRATVGLAEPGKAIELRVAAERTSGRRFFLPEAD